MIGFSSLLKVKVDANILHSLKSLKHLYTSLSTEHNAEFDIHLRGKNPILKNKMFIAIKNRNKGLS